MISLEWQRLKLALQFLTRLPLRVEPFEPAQLNHSARYFPLVGALVGALGAAVLLPAARVWPLPVAVLLSMAATVLFTGAFHEDGLADTCDGLGGGVTRERALEIMKDSRIGSYGALALVLTLGVKATLLHALADADLARAAAALVFAHAASRCAAVLLLARLAYAGDEAHAKARPLARRIARTDWIVALASVAALALLLARWLGAARLGSALGVAAIATLLIGRWLRRRLGGYTGDTLGATQQWTESILLLALA